MPLMLSPWDEIARLMICYCNNLRSAVPLVKSAFTDINVKMQVKASGHRFFFQNLFSPLQFLSYLHNDKGPRWSSSSRAWLA